MDKQVDLMQQQEKMKGQLYKEEEHRDPKFKDPKSLMYDDMKNISQEQIITNLKRMENMDRTNAEGIKQAKPLFGSAGEGQTQERKSKMKKSARKKSAKDLAKIDQDRMQYLADVEKKKIWLENPSYVPYVNLMQKRPEITSERKDVTGHERRMRAESNSKQVHATKKEMDRDLDNLVDNMMKDLYLSGKYEPSEKLKDFRKVQGIEKNMAKQKNKTKKKIVAAAWRLFYKNGYDNTTVDAIIRESGTSKGTFYHYFSGKDSLLSSLSYLFDDKYEELIEDTLDELGFDVDIIDVRDKFIEHCRKRLDKTEYVHIQINENNKEKLPFDLR